MPTYLDASALAKWYVPETRSDEFAQYMQSGPRALTSRLTVLELRSMLSRRRRENLIDASEERRAWAAFRQDLIDGLLEPHPVADSDFESAVALLDRLRRHPLKTLDSLHLTIAERLRAAELATADRVMASAGRALGLTIVWFGPP